MFGSGSNNVCEVQNRTAASLGTRGTRSFKTLIYIIIRKRNIEEEIAEWREIVDTFQVIKFMEDIYETFTFFLDNAPTAIPRGL